MTEAPPPDGAAAALLQVDDISLRFGGVTAIDSVSFEVREGELFAIIGPNGAGKTSIFNSISQVYRPQSGDIRWKGASIMGTRPTGWPSSGWPAPSRTSSCSPT